ncbi:unnamed protein product, partial [Prorocentrum cordatum]
MGRNGQKSGRYACCGSCGKWVWEDKLEKAKGWCGACGKWIGLPSAGHKAWTRSTPPWWSTGGDTWGPTPGEASLDGGVEAALALLRKEIPEMGQEMAALAKKHEKPPPAAPPKSTWQLMSSAQHWHTKAQNALFAAEAELQQAEEVRAAAELRREDALVAALDAQLAMEKATKTHYEGVAKKKEAEPAAEPQQSVLDFECADALCELDDYEDGPIKEEASERLYQQAEAHQKDLLEKAGPGATAATAQSGSGGGAGASGPPEAADAPEAAAAPPASQEELTQRQAKLDELRARTAAEVVKGGGKGAGSRRGRMFDERDSRHIFFANVEKWGPQAHKFLNELNHKKGEFAVAAMCETHVAAAGQGKLLSDLDKDGWKCSHTAALATGKSAEGCSGGELVATRRSLAASTFDHVRAAARLRGGEDPFRGFSAMTLHAKAGNCVMVSAYMVPRWGPGSPNQGKLASLAAFLAAIEDPWVVAADWNLEPQQLVAMGFPTKVGGTVVTPRHTTVTCSKGAGSLIDYCLVRSDFVQSVEVRAFLEVPWRVHCGLDITLKGSSEQWWARALVVPRGLPRAQRPRRAADPDSKTSRMKQRRLEERRARLPEVLREAFTELHEEEEDAAPAAPTVPFAITAGQWNAVLPREPEPYLAETAAMDDHLAYQRPGVQEQRLSQRYGDWVSRVEEAVLNQHEVCEAERSAYRGRARGYAVAWKRVRSTPGRAHMRCHKAEKMSFCATLVQRYHSLMCSKKNEQQRVCVAARLSGLVTELKGQGLLSFFGDDGCMDMWCEQVQAIRALNRPAREQLQETTDQLAARGQARALGESRRAFTKWAKTAWREHAGLLHQHVKPDRPIVNELVVEGPGRVELLSQPSQIMDKRAEKWGALWQDTCSFTGRTDTGREVQEFSGKSWTCRGVDENLRLQLI